MSDLPPELIPRRDAIHDRVIKQGRARRLQRRLAVVVAIVVIVALPVTAVALNGRDDGTRQVRAIAPRDDVTTTTAEPSTTALATTTPTTPTTPPRSESTTTPTIPDPTTTTVLCRNSRDPACGAFFFDPPLTNEPATVAVTVKTASAKPGTRVVFEIHATDPDSFVGPGGDTFCGDASFGDGNRESCGPGCLGPGERYGPWDPPPLRPSDATFTLGHIYAKAGTYKVDITITADECGPRSSEASATATVHVSP
jgi:hypothetical protein